jgi:transcriptional regulator with XRE-family HTH domain
MEAGLSAQEIADRLDNAVRRRGITYAQVARAAGVTGSAASQWKWSAGERDLVQWRRLSAICREFGISADEILGVTPKPETALPKAAADEAARLLLAALQILGAQETPGDTARRVREMLDDAQSVNESAGSYHDRERVVGEGAVGSPARRGPLMSVRGLQRAQKAGGDAHEAATVRARHTYSMDSLEHVACGAKQPLIDELLRGAQQTLRPCLLTMKRAGHRLRPLSRPERLVLQSGR